SRKSREIAFGRSPQDLYVLAIDPAQLTQAADDRTPTAVGAVLWFRVDGVSYRNRRQDDADLEWICRRRFGGCDRACNHEHRQRGAAASHGICPGTARRAPGATTRCTVSPRGQVRRSVVSTMRGSAPPASTTRRV